MTAALILAASSALHLLTLIRLARVTDQRDQARSALRERNAL